MEENIAYIINEADKRYLPKAGNSYRLKAQVLTDLGYLQSEFLIDALKEKKISGAYNIFYKELINSGLLSGKDINNIETVFQEEADVKLLELVTDIDEGLTFKRLPVFGESGIHVRILHYRLNLLGLYDGKISQDFNSLSYTGLEFAAKMVNRSKLVALNLMADIQNFTDYFLKSKGYQNSIVAFEIEQGVEIPDYSGKFKRRLKKDLKKFPDIFETLEDNVFHRRDDKVNQDYIKKLEGEEINRFVIRLLQLHQWMSGNYNGALDSKMGVMSVKGFEEIIEQYNESGTEKVKTGEVLVKVTESVGIFNFVYFLEKYKAENHQQDRTIQTIAVISESYANASSDDQKVFRDNFQNEINKVISEEDKLPESGNNLMRRIFLGIKTFFKKAFKIAGRIFKWIVDTVKKAANFIRNTIRMIYSFLKQAIKHFIEGVKFLLGKLPVVNNDGNGNLLFSNFDIDKDGISIYGTMNPDMLKFHIKNVHSKVKSMSFSLSLISFLFKALKTILSSATIIAWPVFALKLVTAFKKVIDSYKLVLTV